MIITQTQARLAPFLLWNCNKHVQIQLFVNLKKESKEFRDTLKSIAIDSVKIGNIRNGVFDVHCKML